MYIKFNLLALICRRKINTFLLQKEIKNLEKASYLNLWERIELKRAIAVLSTLKQQPLHNQNDFTKK